MLLYFVKNNADILVDYNFTFTTKNINSHLGALTATRKISEKTKRNYSKIVNV